MAQYYRKRDKIEVSSAASSPPYYSATVLLPSPANQDGYIYVKYSTLLSKSKKRLKEYVSATRVRPKPDVELHRFYKEGDCVEVDYCGAWRAGRVIEILENSRYVVVVAGEKEEEEVVVDQWSLRIHRDWVGGSWVPPFPLHQVKSPDSSEEQKKPNLRIKFRIREPKYRPGTIVEIKHEKEGRQTWFNAIIVDSIGDERFFVEYQSHGKVDTKIQRESVDSAYIRPCPSEVAREDRYILWEEVDVLCNGIWLVGHISKVLADDKYIVRVGSKNDVLIVEHSKVRTHQEWIDGKWVASTQAQNQEITRMETESDCHETQPKAGLKSSKGITTYRRKSMRGMLGAEFRKGTLVEVKSDEEGYHGSWYTATVVSPAENDMFTIEYQYLKTEDESELLKEKVLATHIRPSPPKIRRLDRFRLFERVDVWYNDGWWVGIVTRRYEEIDYTLYFWTTNEELECDHFCLRPHQEWVDGKFVADFKKPQVPLQRPRPAKASRKNNCIPPEANIYTMGMKVEVRSNEEGYSGTWYPAIMLGAKGNGTFKVEYKTLKDDEEMKLLNEIVDYQDMRPGPPVTQRATLFDLHDEVEVWYKLGWWHGYICEVYKGSKYAVHVKGEEKVVEFEHSEIRLYRNWVNGKWPSTS